MTLALCIAEGLNPSSPQSLFTMGVMTQITAQNFALEKTNGKSKLTRRADAKTPTRRYPWKTDWVRANSLLTVDGEIVVGYSRRAIGIDRKMQGLMHEIIIP